MNVEIGDALEQHVEIIYRILENIGIDINEKQQAQFKIKLRREIGGTNVYFPSKKVESSDKKKVIQREMSEFKRKLAKKFKLSVRQLDSITKINKHDATKTQEGFNE